MLIAGNWYCYIWAAVHEQLVQASLGYFITPLVSTMLGVFVLAFFFPKVSGTPAFIGVLIGEAAILED